MNNKDRFRAVSYTHLDVYKRQVLLSTEHLIYVTGGFELDCIWTDFD